MPVWIKSHEDIAGILAACERLVRALNAASLAIVPGVTTLEINNVFERELRATDAEPALLGFRRTDGREFPFASCVSVNEQATHGLPGPRRIAAGDVVTIDGAALFQGWHSDASVSIAVGELPRATALVHATRATLGAALASISPATPWSAVARAAQIVARTHGFELAPGFDGHGIGRALHEPPRCWLVDDDSDPHPDFDLRQGMVLTIEPVLVEGSPQLRTAADGWSVSTADGSWACHEEITLAVGRNGPVVLTPTPAVP